jgi:hypothetical protein
MCRRPDLAVLLTALPALLTRPTLLARLTGLLLAWLLLPAPLLLTALARLGVVLLLLALALILLRHFPAPRRFLRPTESNVSRAAFVPNGTRPSGVICRRQQMTQKPPFDPNRRRCQTCL